MGDKRGRLTVTIHWPKVRPQLIPVSTQSITVTINAQSDSTEVAQVTIDQPKISQPSTTVNTVALPIGTFIATATADAAGSASLARGTSQPFTTTLNGLATFAVDMTTTIDHLEITGSPTVEAGSQVQLMASGVDASGSTVLVSPANLSWSSTTPNYATVDPSTGIATGIAEGTATIDVTDGESGKSGSGSLTVTGTNITATALDATSSGVDCLSTGCTATSGQ